MDTVCSSEILEIHLSDYDLGYNPEDYNVTVHTGLYPESERTSSGYKCQFPALQIKKLPQRQFYVLLIVT
jgi:hypothetical protein